MSGSSSSTSIDASKRRRLLAELSTTSCTKTGVAKILKALHSKGLLSDDVAGLSERTLRENLQQGTESFSNMETPYGRVITNLVPGDKNSVEVVNPFAYLHALCGLHRPLFDALRGHGPHHRLIVYIDEVRPGNPLRAEEARQTQCVYWTFADLPDHLLVCSDAWFIAGAFRSTVMGSIAGGVSGFMKLLLKLYFKADTNFTIGIVVSNGNDNYLLQASFAGFLADEKALREIFLLKGAAGTKPCPTCLNVVQFLSPEHRRGSHLVDIDCSDHSLLHYTTDAGFYEAVTMLEGLVGGTKAALHRAEQIHGLSYDEHGLLFDPWCKTLVLPISHYLRDWMHILVSHGVLGTEMAMLLGLLKGVGIKAEVVQSFARAFTLPKHLGKVSDEWFAGDRTSEDAMRFFAGELLTMTPLLASFLEQAIEPRGLLAQHCRCFKMMARIIALLQLGPSGATQHVDELRALISAHHDAYVSLYPKLAIKPKWHHMMHLPEQVGSLGKALSCFVTERKHKQVKAAATWTYKYYEHTVLRNLLHHQSVAMDNPAMWSAVSMHGVLHNVDGVSMDRAFVARLPCGAVHRTDLVGLVSKVVGEVVCFWAPAGTADIVAQVRPLLPTASANVWARSNATSDVFVPATDIVATLIFASRSDGTVHALLPASWGPPAL